MMAGVSVILVAGWNVAWILAWVPFLQPLPIGEDFTLMMLPVVLAMAIVVKATKLRDLRHLPQQAAWLTLQIAGFMVVAAIVLWLIAAWV